MLPNDAAARKNIPLATGAIDYFPDALIAVAELSKAGNEQHNPGKPLHWDRSKSGDEADALMRHFVERGTKDTDGIRHSAKVAWRALALLQKELEAAALAAPTWIVGVDPASSKAGSVRYFAPYPFSREDRRKGQRRFVNVFRRIFARDRSYTYYGRTVIQRALFDRRKAT